MTESSPESSGLFVQSFARGLEVIRAFQPGQPAMTLTDVAEATGYSRATVRRFLHTLVHLGYMRTDGKSFELTPQVMSLGYAYLSSQPLPSRLAPILEELSAQLGESTSASVLEGTDVIYIARQQTRRIMHVDITVGTRFPAYATSMGRVLLAGLSPAELNLYFETAQLQPLTPQTTVNEESLRAELATIRANGWCLVDQELEVGLRSLAVPVMDHSGNTIAAINTSMSAYVNWDQEQLSSHIQEILPPMQDAARKVSEGFL